MATTQFLKRLHLPLHIVGHYVVWLVCVFGAAGDWVTSGISGSLAFILFLIVWQFVVVKDHQHLWLWLLTVTLVGSCVDSVISYTGWIQFMNNPWRLAPPWIMVVWLSFALVLFALLKHWFSKVWLMSISAGIGFPLAFYAGHVIGAAAFPKGFLVLAIYGVTWGVLLPIMCFGFIKLTTEGA